MPNSAWERKASGTNPICPSRQHSRHAVLAIVFNRVLESAPCAPPVSVLARETTVREMADSLSDTASAVVRTGLQFGEPVRVVGSTWGEAE
jgi:hypothetical protein